MQDKTHAVFWHAYCLSYLALTRLKNTFSRGLQNRPLWRRRPPHSTQISVQRVTFSSLETKRSHTGPNLENMVYGVAVRSPIRSIWPLRGRKCELVHCHYGRALFFRQETITIFILYPEHFKCREATLDGALKFTYSWSTLKSILGVYILTIACFRNAQIGKSGLSKSHSW